MTSAEVGIVTTDGATLAAFYASAFGFAEVSEMTFPQGVVRRLSRDHARLKIFQPVDGAAAVEPRNPWHRDQGMAYAALLVDDAASIAAAVDAHGGSVEVPVTEHRPGAAYALVRDPEGNVWEVLEETGP